MITVVTPLSFVLNKLWTFAAVRTVARPRDLLEEALQDDVAYASTEPRPALSPRAATAW